MQAQLPKGAAIQRWYRACEGDLRVIAKLPDEPHDVRYTVSYLIDGYPSIERMD